MGLNNDMYTVLVTGTTGLIGWNVTNELLKRGYSVIGVVRNIEKANKMFEINERMSFIVGDVVNGVFVDREIDYIIHGASQTSSKAFIDEPVETITTALQGTINLLDLAKEKKVKGFVYLSSMEVYGAPITDEKIVETYVTNINTMEVRSSYSESKRMCETICKAYCEEYGVPAKVVRLTQTFGKGVDYNDNRVFAEFARCVIEKKDIILHTKGETKRNYLSTDDAVSAILTVLFNGTVGEVYNAANEETYCSIFEMAQLVAGNKISVRIEEEQNSARGYAPVLHMNLDTSKLYKLGWKATKNLSQMYEELIEDMRGQVS